jgi:hypothetical protein
MSAQSASRLAATLLLLPFATRLAAQQPTSHPEVRTIPVLPVRGTLARLVVTADTTRSSDSLGLVGGEAAGEPLHFEADTTGAMTALFGIPLEGGDELAVTLRLERVGAPDSVVVALPVQSGRYPSERLTVPPRLAQPDSAARERIAAEQAESREVSYRAHQTPRLWAEPFRLPRPSRITSRYGAAREYNGAVTSRHLGTDFAGGVGAPVRAAGRGAVALVADFYLAGHAIYLDHGAGLLTAYFHLSRTDVVAGDTVAAGQVIGAVGRSGRVTGPHLHWIARYGTITVDAESLLELTEK